MAPSPIKIQGPSYNEATALFTDTVPPIKLKYWLKFWWLESITKLFCYKYSALQNGGRASSVFSCTSFHSVMSSYTRLTRIHQSALKCMKDTQGDKWNRTAVCGTQTQGLPCFIWWAGKLGLKGEQLFCWRTGAKQKESVSKRLRGNPQSTVRTHNDIWQEVKTSETHWLLIRIFHSLHAA